MMNVSLEWKEKMQFEAFTDSNEYQVLLDSSLPDIGGEGKGVTPKHLFLQSIAGCTAMDVVHILSRMRAELPGRFAIQVQGEVADKEPKVFTAIEMIYIVEGNVDANKLIRAVKMSQETYCALSIMVKKVTAFTYRVILNGEDILSESNRE
jgi:putative redox protein